MKSVVPSPPSTNPCGLFIIVTLKGALNGWPRNAYGDEGLCDPRTSSKPIVSIEDVCRYFRLGLPSISISNLGLHLFSTPVLAGWATPSRPFSWLEVHRNRYEPAPNETILTDSEGLKQSKSQDDLAQLPRHRLRGD